MPIAKSTNTAQLALVLCSLLYKDVHIRTHVNQVLEIFGESVAATTESSIDRNRRVPETGDSARTTPTSSGALKNAISAESPVSGTLMELQTN
jgi:hypothetical protein